MELALGGPITCGVPLNRWVQFADTGAMLVAQLARVIAQGVTDRNGRHPRQGAASGRWHAAGGRPGGVLAAGVWSGAVVRSLGLRVPVAALAGYHHQVANPGVTLNFPVFYAKAALC